MMRFLELSLPWPPRWFQIIMQRARVVATFQVVILPQRIPLDDA